MLVRDFIDLAVEKAKEYHKSELYSAIIIKYQAKPITDEMIQDFLGSFVERLSSSLSSESDMAKFLVEKLTSYIPEAINSTRNNGHMNKIGGIKEDIMCQDWSDAILVDFVNYISVTQCVDLAMYTCDLY